MKEKDYAAYLRIIDNTFTPSTVTQSEQRDLFSPLANWLETHTPSKLYKFRECNENNINAFRNEQIWFATGAKMNDDYDATLYSDNKGILSDLHSLFDESGNLIFLQALKDGSSLPPTLYEVFGGQYIENAKQMISLAGEDGIKQISSTIRLWAEEGFKEQFPFITQSVQNVVKISSFSERIGSPLMWGKYTNNSSGFALAYDFRNGKYNECGQCKKLGVTCFDPKTNLLLPIVYRDKRINATEYARYIMQLTFTQRILSNVPASKEFCEKVLSTVTCSDTFMQTKIVVSKFSDWDYEKEWRMTVSYNSPYYATDQTTNIWKKPCALYLGRKIKDTDELVLRNIAYKQHIPVYKMEIDETSDDYQLKPIRQRNTHKDLIIK
ncbi:MAG: DUF2971 domain-containing protein [Clostridiales bacterium]|nr:DUF2971 domain-containing protein [Clostridiales bacterium]